MLLLKEPAIYLEIGSGNSTKFARLAIRSAQLETQIVSIDPFPRTEIDDLCDRLIRNQLEDCDQSIFDQIKSGDIVFFDGSHRVFTNSDVTVFFLEILPRLPKGTIVHVHDIFLPADYPAHGNARKYSEQYILAAMMLGRVPPFKVLLPNYYACIDPQMSPHVTSLVGPYMNEFRRLFLAANDLTRGSRTWAVRHSMRKLVPHHRESGSLTTEERCAGF
jgi:Methyltransferase domain